MFGHELALDQTNAHLSFQAYDPDAQSYAGFGSFEKLSIDSDATRTLDGERTIRVGRTVVYMTHYGTRFIAGHHAVYTYYDYLADDGDIWRSGIYLFERYADRLRVSYRYSLSRPEAEQDIEAVLSTLEVLRAYPETNKQESFQGLTYQLPPHIVASEKGSDSLVLQSLITGGTQAILDVSSSGSNLLSLNASKDMQQDWAQLLAGADERGEMSVSPPLTFLGAERSGRRSIHKASRPSETQVCDMYLWEEGGKRYSVILQASSHDMHLGGLALRAVVASFQLN